MSNNVNYNIEDHCMIICFEFCAISFDGKFEKVDKKKINQEIPIF